MGTASVEDDVTIRLVPIWHVSVCVIVLASFVTCADVHSLEEHSVGVGFSGGDVLGLHYI